MPDFTKFSKAVSAQLNHMAKGRLFKFAVIETLVTTVGNYIIKISGD